MRIHFKSNTKMMRKLNIIFLFIFIVAVVSSANVPTRRKNYRKTLKRPNIYRRSWTENFPWRRTAFEIVTTEAPEWIPISGFTMNKTMSCATNLIDKHTEVCDIVFRIGQLQELFPRLREMIEKRMGGRKFTFTIYMNRSSTTVEMLADAGKALLRCIAKFVRFLGYVEKLFAATVGTDYEDLSSDKRRGFFDATELTGFLGDLGSIETFDDKEVQQIVKNAWSRKCAVELLKTNSDVCGITSRINALDDLLKGSKVELSMIRSNTIPVKLNTEELSLTNFLDAIRAGLLGARNIKNLRGIRSMEVDESSFNGKRILLNNDQERIQEIFETPEFKVELLEDETRKLMPSEDKIIENDKTSQKNVMNTINNMLQSFDDIHRGTESQDEANSAGIPVQTLQRDVPNPKKSVKSLSELISILSNYFINKFLQSNTGIGTQGDTLFTNGVDFEFPSDLIDSLNSINIENVLGLLQMKPSTPKGFEEK